MMNKGAIPITIKTTFFHFKNKVAKLKKIRQPYRRSGSLCTKERDYQLS
jgi:hypothetical protein